MHFSSYFSLCCGKTHDLSNLRKKVFALALSYRRTIFAGGGFGGVHTMAAGRMQSRRARRVQGKILSQ